MQSNKLRPQLDALGSASHDLRTPLHALLNLHELLQDTGLNAEQAHLLDHAQQACGALQRSVDELLARDQTPKWPPPPSYRLDTVRATESPPSTCTLRVVPDGMRLLVVDDNELGRTVTRMQLERMGASVECASDGVTCIGMLVRLGPAAFDCILMDVHMPDLDGLSTARLIRALPGFGHQRVIALSAGLSEPEMEEMLAAGIDAFVAKPFDRATLANSLVST